jgi:hypothetical protein
LPRDRYSFLELLQMLGREELMSRRAGLRSDASELLSYLTPSDVVAAVAAEALRLRQEADDSTDGAALGGSEVLETLLADARLTATHSSAHRRETSSKPGYLSPFLGTAAADATHTPTLHRTKCVSKSPVPTNSQLQKKRQVAAAGNTSYASETPAANTPLMLQLRRSAVEMDLLRRELETLKAAKQESTAAAQQLEAAHSALRTRCESLQETADASAKTVCTLQAEAAAADAKFQSLLSWARAEESLRSTAEADAAELRQELLTADVRGSRCEADGSDLADQLNLKRHQLEEALEELRQRTRRSEALEAQNNALSGEAAALRTLLAGRETELQQLQQRLDKVVQEAKALSSESVQLQSASAEAAATLAAREAAWSRDSAERERALAHKQEELSVTLYKLQQAEARGAQEADRRLRAEEALRRSESREQHGRAELLLATTTTSSGTTGNSSQAAGASVLGARQHAAAAAAAPHRYSAVVSPRSGQRSPVNRQQHAVERSTMLYGSTPAASTAAAAVVEQSSSSRRYSSAPAVGQSVVYTTPQGWANSAANSGVSSCSAIAAGVTGSCGGGAVQSPTTGQAQRLQPVPLDADSDASYQQHVIHSPLRQQALSPTRAQHMLAMELPPPARA